MHNITDNLLDQQRINMNRLQIKRQNQDFILLTDQVLEEMSPLFEEKKIELQLDKPESPLMLDIDPIRIGQVMVNLLENAIKYSKEDDKIEIKIKDKPEEVVFNVKDHGYGLRKEDLDELFKPFPSIDKPSRYRSTGLGLSISKGIIDLHGGFICADSEGLEKGAVFCFTLPKPRHRA